MISAKILLFAEKSKDYAEKSGMNTTEEYEIKQRANSKSYEKDREKVIARVRANQRRHQELGQLEDCMN